MGGGRGCLPKTPAAAHRDRHRLVARIDFTVVRRVARPPSQTPFNRPRGVGGGGGVRGYNTPGFYVFPAATARPPEKLARACVGDARRRLKRAGRSASDDDPEPVDRKLLASLRPRRPPNRDYSRTAIIGPVIRNLRDRTTTPWRNGRKRVASSLNSHPRVSSIM